jgi:hypothetical protein
MKQNLNPMNSRLIPAFFILVLMIPACALAGIFRVGPGRQYTAPGQVAGLLAPGDTVLVDGNTTYAGGIVFRNAGSPDQRIVIMGIPINGNRPVISGGSDGVTFRTDYPYDGPGADCYTFEGFEVTGATNRGIFHQAKDLIIRDVVVHNCMHGILGADQGSGSCLLEYSEIYSCGSGSSYHQIYMATDEVHNPGSVFRMQFCYVHDGAGGNNVKSRAERNEIYYNWIEGAYYHELELIGPDGGDGGNPRLKREDSDVCGNVLWKKTKPAGDTEFFNVTRIGGDGTGESHGRYRFVNNTFICGSRAVFRMFDSLESVEMHNNVFYRIDGTGVQIMRTVEALWTTGAPVIAGSNNWVQTGSSQVPSQWSGTVTGSSPGFADIASGDLRPGSGSPLINGGKSNPSGPVGFPFASPLYPPAYIPPPAARLSPGTAQLRAGDGAIDIGAFERPASEGVMSMDFPAGFRLGQNYPNPANPVTTIPYEIPASMHVVCEIFDISGGKVLSLDQGIVTAGVHTVQWHAGRVSSGIYYYRITAGQFTMTRALVLVR